jgi:hypothetical protein
VASNAITITSSMLIAAMPVVKALSAATEAGQGSGLSDLLGTHAPTATDWGMHDTLALPETFDGADDFPMAAGNVFGTPATHFGADTPGLAHVLSHGFIVW